MKTIKHISILFLLFIFCLNTRAQEERFTKTIKREFTINGDVLIAVSNKFGDIHCTGWDEQKVSFEVIIEVFTNDEQQADKIFDKINIEFAQEGEKVEAVTLLEKFKSDPEKFGIDYHIKIPESANLEFANKFGDMFLGNVSGKTDLKTEFGSLQVTTLKNTKNLIHVKHGELLVENINEAEIHMQYSDLHIKNTKALDVISEYSELEINKIQTLTIQSAFDEVEIGEVINLNNKAKYSEFEIEQLQNSLHSVNNFGEMAIELISDNFSTVEIDANYTGIELGIAKEANYSYEVQTKFSSYYAPDALKSNKEKLDVSKYTYKGKYGTKQSTSNLKLISNFGTIEIK